MSIAHMGQSLGDPAAALLQLLDLDVLRWAPYRFMVPECGDDDCLAFDFAGCLVSTSMH